MPEPILVVDLSASLTSAAIVAGERCQLVGGPGPAGTWPPVSRTGRTGLAAGAPAADSADALNALTAVLTPLRTAAQQQCGRRVERLVTAAASAPPVFPPTAASAVSTRGCGAVLIAAGHAAGLRDVELVPDAVAAVLDQASGPGFRLDEVVLVCELDETQSVALVRVAGDQTAVLAGRSLAGAVAGWWERVAETARELADESGVGPASTVLTGSWVRYPGVVDYFQEQLPGRVRPGVDPSLAVLRGLSRWAAGAGRRRVPAEQPRWRVEPISWPIPDREGQVLRWLVSEGSPFTAGTVLAEVRTGADRIYQLAADADGALLGHRVTAGAGTGPTLVAAVAPAAPEAPQHPPPHRHRWSGTGGWLLTAEELVEWDAGGDVVQLRSVSDGAVSGQLRADHGDSRPRRAGVFFDPAGRLSLLTWNRDGEFWVWDVATGSLRQRFTGPAGASRVLVHEPHWCLAVEVPEAVTVGRYRRTAVTRLDLATGHRIDRMVDDDWGRRHPGYAARSAADQFATRTASPDGRLRVEVSGGAVRLYETAGDRQVFQAAEPSLVSSPTSPRAAFSADGRFLLASWESDDRSIVDVWQL